MLDILLCGIVLMLEIIGAVVLALLVQFTVYQLTGFSIYNWLVKKLFKEVL